MFVKKDLIVTDENSADIKVKFNAPSNSSTRLTDFRLARGRIIEAKFQRWTSSHVSNDTKQNGLDYGRARIERRALFLPEKKGLKEHIRVRNINTTFNTR